MSSLARKLVTSLVAGLVTVVLAEGALRVFEGSPKLVDSAFLGEMQRLELQPDEELFWKLRPGDVDGTFVNRHGLRGYFPDGPKGDTVRILCVGDSCTFGAGVDHAEIYGIRVENLLRERRSGVVETILAGTPGYSTDQNRTQLEALLPRLQPDVTVLYVGAWNDYVACTGRTDRQRRTTRLALSRLLARFRERRALERVRESFREGEGEYGPRVPLEDFDDNVRGMIQDARRQGSEVVVLIPPLPVTSRERRPVVQEYWKLLRDAAADLGAELVDANLCFEQLARRLGTECGLQDPDSLLFADWVHPSREGHRVLAHLLMPILQQVLPAAGPTQTPSPRTDLRVEAQVLEPFTGGRVTLSGSLEGVQRIWVNGVWLRPTSNGSDHTLTIPPGLPPGRHPLLLERRGGIHETTDRVTVRAPDLQVQALDRKGPVVVELLVEAPADSAVAVWVAEELRTAPVLTEAGLFRLEDPARVELGDDVPFLFETLKLYKLPGQVPENGAWRREFVLDRKQAGGTLYLQGLVSGGSGHTALTEAVRLDL